MEPDTWSQIPALGLGGQTEYGDGISGGTFSITDLREERSDTAEHTVL